MYYSSHCDISDMSSGVHLHSDMLCTNGQPPPPGTVPPGPLPILDANPSSSDYQQSAQCVLLTFPLLRNFLAVYNFFFKNMDYNLFSRFSRRFVLLVTYCFLGLRLDTSYRLLLTYNPSLTKWQCMLPRMVLNLS